MRVIAGNAGGRRLKAPKGMSVRPTADRVKESLFNILANDFVEARILDLFSGTGNLAIEALSRGAAHAVLVDASAAAAKLIRENLQSLGLSERATVMTASVRRALSSLASQERQFDIVFLDPPYGESLVPETVEQIARAGLLTDTGIVVAEHSTRDAVQMRYLPLERVDQRRYGDTVLSFYRQATQTLERGTTNHGQ